MSQRKKEKDWKDEVRQQIIDAAEEIKAAGAETVLASEKTICCADGFQILIEINPHEMPTVEYRIRSIPRRFWSPR